MEIVVMGAGITGVTAAYVLASRGHKVTVLEQESAPALQTSFSNGAQLSYSHAEPWANPAVFGKLLGWAFRSDAPLVLRPRAELRMLKWSCMFLMNCSAARSRENCERMWRIASYSKQKMAQIRAETAVEFDFLPNGILHVFSDRKAYEGAIKQAEYQESLGCKEHIFSKMQVLEKEPALANAKKDIIGGLYSDIDESGDIHMFTTNLATYCREHLGVQFFYGAQITSIEKSGSKITGVKSSQGNFSGDAYVLSLGAYSALLAAPLGVKLPIYPMKGYSITVPAWEDAPFVSITDDEKKVVFSRLGDKVRAAGTAEFAGYNTQVRERRIAQIIGSLESLFPHAVLDERMTKWACIRPQTPDGPPIIGRTDIDNLFLNTGHGTLGWTQGAGTAHLLADIMEGRETEIKIAGLELSRYRK
jgi:D-amino-acid dehydrogenase